MKRREVKLEHLLPPDIWRKLIEIAKEKTAPGLVNTFGPQSNPHFHIHVHMKEGDSMSKSNQFVDNSSGPTGAKAFGKKSKAKNSGPVVRKVSRSKIDLAELAQQLDRLLVEMKRKAQEAPHFRAIADVADAQAAARDGKIKSVWKHLKSAGKWSFDVAKEVGVQVAATAIASATGISG